MFDLQAFHKTLPPEFRYIKSQLVGSTYILGQGNDIDIIFLVENLDQGAIQLGEDWELFDDEHYDTKGRFCSLRQGIYNLLLVEDAAYYKAWATAAEVCKFLKLSDKSQRVSVHCIIMDGNTADEFTQEDSPPDCPFVSPEPPALTL